MKGFPPAKCEDFLLDFNKRFSPQADRYIMCDFHSSLPSLLLPIDFIFSSIQLIFTILLSAFGAATDSWNGKGKEIIF